MTMLLPFAGCRYARYALFRHAMLLINIIAAIRRCHTAPYITRDTPSSFHFSILYIKDLRKHFHDISVAMPFTI